MNVDKRLGPLARDFSAMGLVHCPFYCPFGKDFYYGLGGVF